MGATHRARAEQKTSFKHHLEYRLEQLQITDEDVPLVSTLGGQDIHCKDSKHSEARDSHVLDLLTAVIEASHATLPMYGGCWVGEKRHGVSIPGWNKEVKPFRDDSLYWGNIWRQAGCPNRDWIHDNYVEARRQYHRAVLRVRRMREVHQAEELLVAAMEGDVQLLKEMKTIKQGVGVSNAELPDSVGGADGEEQIGEMFRESYEKLYNSASSGPEMEEMKKHLENLVDIPAKEEISKVTGGYC